MRKIISLLLCCALCCLLLVGCAEEIIGKDLLDYLNTYVREERSSVVLDFYIITGDETTSSAKKTVTASINAYLSDVYMTTLDIHYLTESEYKKEVMADAYADGENRADIVLVVGEDMFNELHGDGMLVPLNSYYYSKDFGRLNSSDMIASALLEASSVTEEVDGVEVGMRYVVPNNRVVGQYSYVMVNREIAHYLNFSDSKIAEMYEGSDELAALQSDLVTYSKNLKDEGGYSQDDIDSAVVIFKGSYLDREAYIDNGYACIAKDPVVTSKEAHESSFAIIAQEGTEKEQENHYYRCMEIIYAINTDPTVRNLLQYGVLNTHYSMNDNGTPENSNDDFITELENETPYEMSIFHTGNIFTAGYNDFTGENSWSEKLADAGKIQNKDALSE